MPKKYLVKPGQKATIEINRDSPLSTLHSPLKKAMIRPRREPDYLARRLKKYLRIFDCGRASDGSDIEFLIQPTLSAEPGSYLPGDLDAGIDDYAARDSLLFDLPGETLFDKFYEIKQADAELYRVKFLSNAGEEILRADNQLWTTKGVKLPTGILNGENFSISAHYDFFGTGGDNRRFRLNFFSPLRFNGEAQVKTTAVYDYDSSGVTDFRLKAGDALFLMPEICLFKGTASWFFGFHNGYLNYDLRFGLRSFYEGDLEPDSDPTEISCSDTLGGDYPATYAAWAFHLSLDSARGWRYGEEEPNGEVSPETVLPNPPFAPGGFTISSSNSFGVRIDRPFNDPPTGALLAVVLRGSSAFYLWQD